MQATRRVGGPLESPTPPSARWSSTTSSAPNARRSRPGPVRLAVVGLAAGLSIWLAPLRPGLSVARRSPKWIRAGCRSGSSAKKPLSADPVSMRHERRVGIGTFDRTRLVGGRKRRAQAVPISEARGNARRRQRLAVDRSKLPFLRHARTVQLSSTVACAEASPSHPYGLGRIPANTLLM